MDEFVILSTYLTLSPDPQSGIYIQPNEENRLLLATGCNQNEIELCVFHDNLSKDFVKQHTTRFLSFCKVPQPKNLSNNDYRFFLYRDWLARNPYDYVICCDLFDVKLNRHPFPFLESLDCDLVFGAERDWKINDQTTDGRWMLDRYRTCYSRTPEIVQDQQILMAGTWGGTYKHVLRFLVMLCNEISKIQERVSFNSNMPAVNLVAYRDIGRKRIWAEGYPFNSVFKAFETDTDAIFIHK
jgi:hypothetical protein